MAQFLVSTMDAVGHVTPMLPVAIKLVERSHQVWWHTTADFAAKVTATGAHFVPMQHTPTFEALPANARVERFIPHAVLLPHVDVMVTNGGYNGVLTALAHGVPLVAAGRSEDKQEVSARIAWAKAGIDLKTDTPSAEQLAIAVRRVLCEPIFRRNAERIQADFAQHDGPTEAAMLLEQLAQTKRPVT